jgi:hypothetical protein
MTLDEIGLSCGTDKASSHHGFLNFYERFLQEIRYGATTILEIGVYQAASLRMWEQFFPNATIIGLDINEDSRAYQSGRIKIEIGDQANPMTLAALSKHGPFDLIVDDGSHQWTHQITSFRYLYPHVKSGHYYILEDLDTGYGSYVAQYQGDADVSASGYLQSVVDYVVADAMLHSQPERDPFLKYAAMATEFIAFHKRTSILRRRSG